MQSAFGDVVWIVCGIGIVIGILSLVGSGKVWEEFGRRGLLMDRGGSGGAGGRSGGTPAKAAERDEEIRQMLEARNRRRARRGEPPVDIDSELRRLTATDPAGDDGLRGAAETGPAIDDELRGEIREMVLARNHRRARRGLPALDVEAEIEREIANLTSPD